MFLQANAAIRGCVDLRNEGEPGAVTFSFHPSETRSQVEFSIPSEAADWSGCACLQFSFHTTSTARWFFGIINAMGELFEFRFQPLQNVRVKATIPGRFLHHDYTNNRRFKSYALVNWHRHIDLRRVAAIIVGMRTNHEVCLRLGPLVLSQHLVSDAFAVDSPVVDRHGQWIEGQSTGLALPQSVRESWQHEDRTLARATAPPREPAEVDGSGYFRTALVNDRWWLVDPDGRLFFSAGLNCIRLKGDVTTVSDRRRLFTAPGRHAVDFYYNNARVRLGKNDVEHRWATQAIQRMRHWGFNTIGLWSAPYLLHHGLPFVVNLDTQPDGRNWHGFPDVFASNHVDRIVERLRVQVTAVRNDRLLMGYFLGNEPQWQHRALIDTIVNDEQNSATQSFVKKFLDGADSAMDLSQALLELLARRHFQTMCDAVRMLDPNHLILGIRWAGQPPDAVLKASSIFDVCTMNVYKLRPPSKFLQLIDNLVAKPILIGEFHFGATGHGLGGSLVEVRDQEQRGTAYQHYVEQAAAHRSIVGTHYFQLKDQPVTGRFDGENFNIGFVNVLDQPYEPLVAAAQRAHARLNAIHRGTLQPVQTGPRFL